MADNALQGTHATTAPADSGAGGLPQFDLAQWPGQMVWMLIIFGVMFALFAKVFVPSVGGTIAEREDRISGDVGEARRLRDEADAQAAAAAAETAQARAAAQKLALDAKSKAKAEAATREAAEEAKLATTLSHAEAAINRTREAAMGHVREIAADTAQAIVEKLTGVAASADELQTASSGKA
jgi:F-type H+-transporting ATPase subunit b